MAGSIYTQSRSRFTGLFKKNGLVFDPTVLQYEHIFAPTTINVAPTKVDYTYGVDAAIVKTSTGFYYVEYLSTVPGLLKFTWRSTAWGEEVVVEEIVNVLPRTVVT